jgi:hypothetical protein
MKVVRNQCPCIAWGLGILKDLPQSLKKVILIGITLEYLPLFNTPDHYMMDGTSGIYA